ncbi:MAG: hypothetical protein P8X43_01335, partial [Maritimibacter sp.]
MRFPSLPFKKVALGWLIWFLTAQPCDVVHLKETRVSVLNLTLKSLSILRGNAATFARLTAPIFALYAVIQAVAAYQLTGLTPNLIGQANTPHLTASGIVTMYAAMLISLIV